MEESKEKEVTFSFTYRRLFELKNLSLSTGAFSGRFVLMRLEWMGTLMGCHHFTVEFCALKDLLSDRYQVN